MSNILINIKGLDSQELPKGITPLQIMHETKGISKESVICKVDGQLTDLSAELLNDCELQFMDAKSKDCLLYTSPSPRDSLSSRMPSSA